MIIANPIYDVVFKYLLEDIEIARDLLSTIIDEEIISLTVKPQETSIETFSNISLIKFDFVAVIKTNEGGTKKILIELQKSKNALDIGRFRRYLGENYRKTDEVINKDGETEKVNLPIITIYFLGFKLANVDLPVLKVGKNYQDAISKKMLPKPVIEHFIDSLTHECYTIQIPRLKVKLQTKLEKVLEVFSQQYKTKDRHKLDFESENNEPLVKKMIERLNRGIADDELRNKMDFEDEIENVVERELKKEMLKIEKLEEEKQKIEEEKQKIEEENTALKSKIEELLKLVNK